MYKTLFRVLFSLVLLFALFSCSSKLEADEFSEKDVIGSYFFTGYSGSLKRDLEINFDENHTGNGLETSYSTSTGNFLSAHEYIFTWKKEGNVVYLTGVHASASSDGDIGTSAEWSAEFLFKYGMFMPSRGFIDGYAEEMIHGKMKKDVEKYVICDATYYINTCSFGVEISSAISSIWPDYPIMYGYAEKYPDYEWTSFSEKEDIVYAFYDTYVELEYKSLKKLREMQEQGYTLSKTQLEHIKSFEETLNERLKEVQKGKIRYSFAITIGDYVIELKPIVSTTKTKENPYLQDEDKVTVPEAIDLGLSVKWASFNIGATRPEEYGNYYAWGELMTKVTYNWDNYRFRTSGDKNSNVKFNKYNTLAERGPVDNKVALEISDDVANYLLKGSWRMPTLEDIDELLESCEWRWDTENGVSGYRVVSKVNYKSIFLPSAGFMDAGILTDAGKKCAYFTSSMYVHKNQPWYGVVLLAHNPTQAEGIDELWVHARGERYLGMPIRAVTY